MFSFDPSENRKPKFLKYFHRDKKKKKKKNRKKKVIKVFGTMIDWPKKKVILEKSWAPLQSTQIYPINCKNKFKFWIINYYL